MLFAAQVSYYAVRRYPCPACGRRQLGFLLFRSSPWLRTFPVPVRRYKCECCSAGFEEAGGEWERITDDGCRM
jgi:hypothetical protein